MLLITILSHSLDSRHNAWAAFRVGQSLAGSPRSGAVRETRPLEAASDAGAATLDERATRKEELLSIVARSQRGADESIRDQVITAFEALERLNPCEAPVQSPLLKGEWELVWTTSESILGLKRPLPFRPRVKKPILQYLDPSANYARNLEHTWLGTNRVEATISPLTAEKRQEFTSKLDDFLLFKTGSEERPGGTYLPQGDRLELTTVGVRFTTFRIFGWLKVKAPAKATGILQVTYLDEDLRLSRGDRGNLFVLRRVSNEKVA